MTRRTAFMAATALVVSVAITGCEFTGLNSYPLPFTQGGGSDAYTVTVHMANAANLVPNSEAKVNDVTVGAVRRIEFDDWHAVLTVGLNSDVRLPADAIARIGQKSLLGAEYLELAAPEGKTAERRLGAGDVIPLDRTDRYPETEEVLSAVSVVVNGGGFNHLATITSELNNALRGREGDVRSLLGELNTFVAAVDDQREGIIRALNGLNRLSGTLADQKRVIDRAVTTIPKGLRTLRDERKSLTRTLRALSQFSAVATRVAKGGQAHLLSNLRALRPVLKALADAGRDLPESLGELTFPFPIDTVAKSLKGDYINLFGTLDLTIPTLSRDWLAGTPLDGVYAGLLAGPATGPATDAADPLLRPLEQLPGAEIRQRLPKSSSPAPEPAPLAGVGDLIDPLLGGGR